MKLRGVYTAIVHVLLYVLVLFSSASCFAQSTQNTIDSLLRILPHVNEDTNKVKVLSELSRGYYQLDTYKGVALGLQALELSEDIHYGYGIMISNNAVARCYTAQKKLPEALRHFNKALMQARQLKLPAEIARQLISIGSVYKQKGEFDQALNYTMASNKAYEEAGVKNRQMVMNNIGSIYIDKEEYRKALSYFIDGIGMEQASTANPAVLATLYGNLGTAYVGLKQFDVSLTQFFKALEHNKVTGNLLSTANTLCNIGETHVKICIHKVDGLPDSLQNCDKNMATALRYFQQALDITYKAGLPQLRQVILKNISDAYEQMGNYREALTYVELSNILKDSLGKLASEIAFAKAEAEVQVLKATDSLKYENLELRRRKTTRNGIIVIVSLIGVIGWLLTNRQKLKQIQQRKLAEADKLRAEELAQQQLSEFTERIREKNMLIETISGEIEKLKQQNSVNGSVIDEKLITELQESIILTDEQWEKFKSTFDKVHSGYLIRLKNKLPDITPAETRFMVLSKLNLSPKEMSVMLGITPHAVRASKYRLMKKLGFDEDMMLDNLVQNV